MVEENEIIVHEIGDLDMAERFAKQENRVLAIDYEQNLIFSIPRTKFVVFFSEYYPDWKQTLRELI